MAEFRTPFFCSYMAYNPELILMVLNERPDNFPESDRISAGLRPLLGELVFLTNSDLWKQQRRIIDPAFAGGRLRDAFPAIKSAGAAAGARMAQLADGTARDIEPETSHAAAYVIFRTLFSVPIEDQIAPLVFDAYKTQQRAQPILNLAALIPGLRWMPRFFRRDTRATARLIRALNPNKTAARLSKIADGTAQDDLAIKIMTTANPETGETSDVPQMVDQVAIFFLAGHEASAAALAWTLYLLAMHRD
jgi:cytochrome P450